MSVPISIRRGLSRFLVAAAGILGILAIAVWWTEIRVIVLGSFSVPVASASHLLFQASVALLAASLLRREDDGRLVRFLVLLGFLFVSAMLDSPTRQVGDGHEYLTMARNLALLRPPSVIESDLYELRSELLTFGDETWAGLDPAMRDYVLNPGLRGQDGRYDFTHFWLTPLLAAPAVAAARAVQLHPASGFIAFDVACLMLLSVVLLKRAGRHVTMLVACMLLWWVDKVHADVFLVATLGVGLLWLDTNPSAGLILLGLAAAQMPVFASVLPVAVAAAVLRHPRNARLWLVAVASASLVALNPLYYRWHLGRFSPLAALANPMIPGLRLFATPLIDLNLGVFWYAPVLALLAISGLAQRKRACSWSTVLAGGTGVVALLMVAAQSPNLNHGATPGPNRYGVWSLALLIPLVVNAARGTMEHFRTVTLAAVLFTLVFSAVVMHPRVPDGSVRPTALAAVVWTRAPRLDNPIPEVFAERLSHIDGRSFLPIATDGCEKVLLVGDGRSVWWPEWCNPVAVPDICAERGPRCYWNSGAIALAPRQAPFVWRLAPTSRRISGDQLITR
jgi:hypothetical protein